VGPEPARDELQSRARRAVEPLDVVDGDHERPLGRQDEERVQYRDGDRVAIWSAGPFRDQECDLERLPLR
jgi:hypothetical protein